MDRFSIVVACTADGGIGYKKAMPWKIKEDFQYFKKLTQHHVVIMGRKTWESLPRRPLPDRLNIVISRQSNYKCEHAWVCESFEAALKQCAKLENQKIFVIGGAEIYKEAMQHQQCGLIFLTRVTFQKTPPEMDTFVESFAVENIAHRYVPTLVQTGVCDDVTFQMLCYVRKCELIEM